MSDLTLKSTKVTLASLLNKAAQSPRVATQPPREAPQDLPSQRQTSKGPSKLESMAKKNSERVAGFSDLKKIMATIKVYSPLIAAVTMNPGADVDDTQAADITRKLVNETLSMTEVICKLMDVDTANPDLAWVVGQVRVIAATQVGLQWRRSMVLGHEDLLHDAYAAAYKTVVTMDKPLESIDDRIRVSTSAKLQLSMMKSVMPIVREINTFESSLARPGFATGYQIDEPLIMERAGEFIIEQVNDFVSRLNLPENDDSRTIFFQGSLNHAGEIYAACFAHEVDRRLELLESLEPAKRKELLAKTAKANAAGIDLNRVETRFKASFTTLAKLASQAPIAYAEKLAAPTVPKRKVRRIIGDV